jgi:hypothetical protein
VKVFACSMSGSVATTTQEAAVFDDRSSSSGRILELLPIGLLIALIGLLAAILQHRQT